MNNEEREFLLADIASMYFEEHMTQAEIAKKLQRSRSLISSMLAESMRQGIVRIDIRYPLRRAPELERELKEAFDLKDAIVVHPGNLGDAGTLRIVGRMAAAYLQNRLPADGILGIGWGAALLEVANAMQSRPLPDLKVVQWAGSLGGLSDPLIDGSELARSFANILGARCFTLNAPAIVANPSVRHLLLEEKAIKDVLLLGSEADFAVIGIGSTEAGVSNMVRKGYLSLQELAAIRASGAVGDVCCYHFDINGRILDIDINSRVVGVDRAVLTKGRCTVLAVASGEKKAPAICGALRGGFAQILVTDRLAAERVLTLAGKR